MAFFRELPSLVATGLSLLIECPGDGCRAANLAEAEDPHLVLAVLGSDLEGFSEVNAARRFDGLLVRQHAAEFTGTRGQAARLEEPRCPKPLV